MTTIVRMYDDHSAAAAVVNELEAAGIPHSDISLVSSDRTRQVLPAGAPGGHDSVPVAGATAAAAEPAATGAGAGATTGAGAGATTGTILGGGAGLLAGLGMLAIPGVGPVVAAGWLVATLVGAGAGAAIGGGAGGIIGSLTGAGVAENEAHVYAEGVRRGGSLITVRTSDELATRAETVFANHKAATWEDRDREFRGEGWTGFDSTAPDYTAGETRVPPLNPRSNAL